MNRKHSLTPLLGPLCAPLCALALALLPAASGIAREPHDSTYVPRDAAPVLFQNVSVYTGTGEMLPPTDVWVADGKILHIGARDDASMDGVTVVDGTGRWLTPGIIDVHSHLGNYPSPRVPSTSDGNEATAPNTAHVWTEHSVWPQDPQFPLALAGGVTALQILPGSANLFGGRGVTLKNVPSRTMHGMKFPGAKHSLKMACGENPKRVYGSRTKEPSTRMGNVAGYRAAWAKAVDYRKKRQTEDPEKMPAQDINLDTLVGVLDGEILVHNHCYRADEMATMIELSKEFGYKITAFHHAVESYKIADILAEEGICSAMWADWWGFKLEAFDAVQQNVALVDKAGACAIVHSDSPRGIQRLNQEAAKAMAAAQRFGLEVSRGLAWRWISLNAAQSLGIDDETGSIEIGKAADVVLWNQEPLSVYAKADLVLIDGYTYYDRQGRQPVTDFDLHQTVRGGRQ